MSIDGYTRGIPTYKGTDGKTYGHLVETKENCISDDNGVTLANKLSAIQNGTTTVGNANKLGGKGASEYLTTDGGTIENDIVIGTASATTAKQIALKNANRTISMGVRDDGVFMLTDNTNVKRIMESALDGTNAFYGTATNASYLNAQAGNEINFKGLTGKDSLWINRVNADTGEADATALKGYIFSDKMGGENRIMLRLDQGSGAREILHTGNKPSGSYTGNGSSTNRQIATGGLCSVVAIYSDNGVAYVTPIGAILASSSGVTFERYAWTDENKIYLSTANVIVNGNGTTHTYTVL